jgi:hypothetical protein
LSYELIDYFSLQEALLRQEEEMSKQREELLKLQDELRHQKVQPPAPVESEKPNKQSVPFIIHKDESMHQATASLQTSSAEASLVEPTAMLLQANLAVS